MQQTNEKFLQVRPDWLNLYDEPAIDPELPIVDPHHHLWDRLDWRYLIEDFISDLSTGHNIVSTVFVQCHAMHRRTGPKHLESLGETEFANGVAAMSASGNYGATKICDGIVGNVDLRLGSKTVEALEEHIARAGPRFKGIRQITAWDPDESIINPEFGTGARMLSDPKFRSGFSELEKRGLRFDAFLYHTQIRELQDLAKNFPQTPIVLNHIGTPLGLGKYIDDRQQVMVDWKKNMRELSKFENIFIKLGGLGMRSTGLELGKLDRPMSSIKLADRMRPFIEPCIEWFGVERCMFESNFPVDKASYSYKICWNAFKHIAAKASPSEKRALFSNTAATFYALSI